MTLRIIRCIVLSESRRSSLFELKTNLSPIGDTTKKTINRTLAIGVALTATAILIPATFAHDHHEPPRPNNGIRLATDIVNLVRAVFEPRPAPVIVEAPPAVVEKTVIVETAPAPAVVTTTQKTVIVTGAEEVAIPEYSYILYGDEYIPYYDGWLYLADAWYWAGTTPRPAAPPRWTPPPRHRDPKPHKVIVLPDHRPGHGFAHGPAPAIHHDARPTAPPRTVVVRPERRENKIRPERKGTVVRPERKEVVVRAERKEVTTRPAPKEKEKVTVTPDRRKDAPPKKDR